MKAKKKKISHGVAIVGLILNILILPGLGSLIGGKTVPGVLQLVLFIFSLILDITIIGLIFGIPLGIAMWGWGLGTGVQMIKEAE